MARKTKRVTLTLPRKKTSKTKQPKVLSKSLETNGTPSILGRDDEKNQILSFLKTYSTKFSTQGGCLYISGSPGTGKTALIKELLNQFSFPTEPIYINCMNLSTSQAIYQTLYKRLQKNEVKKFISSKDIEVKLNRLKVPLTIVLDEIDQLFTTHSNLLQNVFQWSLKPKVALIGIANSLDLTDRLLPSLSLHHCTPISVTFPAYTSSTLHTILHSYFPHFSTSVLQFVATKVSATSSDVRHALTVCQHAERVAGDATQVTVSHVAQVITPASPWVQALKKLSWSAQLALLSAVSKLPLSIVTWHHQYHRLATTLGMPTISLSELKDIGMHLETLSLLHVRPSKVVLMVPPKEIVRALTTASVIEKVPTTAHELFQQILSTFNEL